MSNFNLIYGHGNAVTLETFQSVAIVLTIALSIYFVISIIKIFMK